MLRLFALAGFVAVGAAVAGESPVRECSYLEPGNRFLEKDFPVAKLKPSTTLIDSFENWETGKASWFHSQPGVIKSESVKEHATDGKCSLKVTFQKPSWPESRLRYIDGTEGWGNDVYERKAALSARVLFNDAVCVDVFNPGEATRLAVKTGKEFVVDLKPGANTLTLKIPEMIAEVFRITSVLQGLQFYLSEKIDKEVVLYFDNVRWVGPGVGENLIQHARLFDCGSASYCRPYFQNVDSTTKYSKDTGYGWENPNQVIFEWTNNMVTQCSTGRQPHDELLRDNVYQINTPFLVDLPDGAWRVHLLEGAMLGWYSLHPSFYDLQIVANDKPVLMRRAARTPAGQIRSYYGLDQTDFEPGEDKFRKYLAADCSPLEVDVEVQGGQLKLEFKTEPVNQAQVSFVIVYPVGKSAAIEPEIAALWRDIAFRFNNVSYACFPRKMAEQMHLSGLHPEYLAPETAKTRRAALKLSPADEQRGFVVFNREPTDEVYPDSVPEPQECTEEFSAFVPRGEIASFAPAVHALKDCQDVRVALTDFTGPAGTRIAPDRVDLRVVNCLYRMSSQQSHGDWRYVVTPWYLVKRDKVNIAAGSSRRWWINVDVPADAAPGRYAGTVVISAGGTPVTKWPLTLEVLPFALDPVPPGIELGMYTGIEPHWYQQPFAAGWRHHVSWRPWSDPEQKKKEIDGLRAEWERLQKAELKAEFGILRRYGFNTIYQWRPDDDLAGVTAGLEVILAEQEMKKLYPQEVWPPPRIHKAEHRKRAYLYKLATWNEGTVEELRKAGYQVSLNFFLAWEDLQQEAGLNRFQSGFLMWRLGAQGCIHNPWKCSWGNPYQPFDGHSGEWGSYCMPGSTSWPTPNLTQVLEGVREGIQDYRWLVTLERLMREKPDSPALPVARKYLKDLRQRLKPDGQFYFHPVGGGGGWGETWSMKDTAWKGAHFRQERRVLAELIVGLLGVKSGQ